MEIDKCWVCPYCRALENSSEYVCTANHKKIVWSEIKTMPEWCVKRGDKLMYEWME